MPKPEQEKLNVLSPDGFPISPQPFASEQEAEKFIPQWVERYKEQGYYLTADRQRIPVEELSNHLEIVGQGDETDIAEGKMQKLGHHVRLGWEKQPIDSEKNKAAVHGAIREQWQKERQEELDKPATPTEPDQDKAKGREIEPPEPGND